MSLQKLGYDGGASPKERGHISFGTVASGAVEAIYDVSGIDVASIQVVSTGTLAATITVLASNSFIPGSNQDLSAAATPIRAGTFTAITSRVTGITDPAGAGGNCIISISSDAEPLIAHSFIKVLFTRTGGSGAVDFYASGKAISR